MLAAALFLQSALTLTFPTGGELIFRETWRVTEQAGDATATATADRIVRMRVKETTRNRTRLEVTFHSLDVRGADKGLNDDLRSWVDQPGRDQWVNERGYVERRDEVRGNRPFFGLVLPAPSRSIPDRWTAKLLAPIGTERSVDFEFRLGSGSEVLPITVSGKDKYDSVQALYEGTISFGANGMVLGGDYTTTLEDSESKTRTVIEYRFRKQ